MRGATGRPSHEWEYLVEVLSVFLHIKKYRARGYYDDTQPLVLYCQKMNIKSDFFLSYLNIPLHQL